MTLSNGNSQRVLVTGGANGFGLATARALLKKGARVAIGDVNTKQLQDAAARLANERLVPIELDVTMPAAVRHAVEVCREKFGGLDALVNAAGIIQFAPLDDISERDWDRVIDVDLKGTFLACQAAAPLLRESGARGRIVNIGSDASKVGWPLIASYCAAKFGVVGLTKAIAGELAPYGVTVNCVCPVGVSSTGMGQQVLEWKIKATGKKAEEILAATASGIPLRRNPTEADIVNAILFFLSEEASFLTGVALDVDGGALSTAALPGLNA